MVDTITVTITVDKVDTITVTITVDKVDTFTVQKVDTVTNKYFTIVIKLENRFWHWT